VNKLRQRKKSFNLNKGGMSTGVGFGIIGMMAIFAMGYMMIGNATPYAAKNDNAPVIISHQPPEPTKATLQLETFPGVTLTPSPTPTLPPEPHEKGGFNYGEAPGGHSAPDKGNGGNPGSAI
jgi:hypothetical protein